MLHRLNLRQAAWCVLLRLVGVSNFLPTVEVSAELFRAINGFISGSNIVSHFSYDQKVLTSSFFSLKQNKHSNRCQHLPTGSMYADATLLIFV